MAVTPTWNFGNLLSNVGQSIFNTGVNWLGNSLFGGSSASQGGWLNPGASGGWLTPQRLLGGGLLGAGAMLDKEPGEVTEARQFLRNRFTSPNALADQFTGQISELAKPFQPLLTQQREQGIADIGRRFAGAFPARLGAQGPEFGTLGRYLTEQALPREQNLLGELGLRMLNYQGDAAKTILDTSKPDMLSQLASLLGYDMLTRGQDGGAGGWGSLGGQGVGTSAGIPGVGTSGGFMGGLPGYQTAVSSLLQMASQTGGLNALLAQSPALLPQIAAILGTRVIPDPTGTLTGVKGYAIETSQGTLIPADAVNLETIGASPAGAPSGGISGMGMLASAGAGYGGGALAGPWLARQAESDSPWRWLNPSAAGLESLGASEQGVGAFTGAQAGAVSGFVASGFNPVGAAIGAITGAFGGFSKVREQQHAQKAAFRQSDLDSQKDQVFELGNIGAEFLSEIPELPQGVMDSFAAKVNQLAATSESPADEQGMVAEELGRLLSQYPHPNRASLRQRFIDYMMTNTFTSGNSRYGGRAPENFISGVGGGVERPWAQMAGLKHGGMVRPGGMAMVGEAGPELLMATPRGAVVMPMLMSRN